MQQLTEMDNNFIAQETAATPMHISPVIVYDQSLRREGRVRFKEILTVFERNLHKSAVFRRRLAGGALGSDTPFWIEDENFDLEFHVRHLALPKPGDWRQFCILLARLQARGLDMKRPLWEAYVIEGLSGVEGLPPNSFAIMLKVHHAAIDGVSGAEIIAAIHSLTDEVAPPLLADPWQGEREPSAWQVWTRAYLHNLRRPLKFFSTMSSLVPAVVRASRDSAEHHSEVRNPLAPKTRFNGRVSATRVTDALLLELDDIKAIRKALDNAVTINDIMVSVVGGALRAYLQDKGELPQQSLSCGAPVNTRAERNSDSVGNQVSMMAIGMATDIGDPLARLQAVHDNAESSKRYAGAIGANVMVDLSEMLIPQVMGWSLHAAMVAGARSDIPIPIHTIVSNVPGPQFPLFLAGAKVHMTMGMGPLVHMMGLFHAVVSGAGKITINFVSTREMLPDPHFYRSCLADAYQALYDAATGHARRGKQRKARPSGGKATAGGASRRPEKLAAAGKGRSRGATTGARAKTAATGSAGARKGRRAAPSTGR